MTHLKRAAVLLLGLTAVLRGGPVPQRVVSQTVGSDELLLAVADPDQIAALSHLARDPEYSAVADEASGFPQLQLNGDAESVIKFQPTLVLCADYSRPELVAQLRRAGVQVLIFDRYATIEDAYANLTILGRMLGKTERAGKVIAECRARVAALEGRLKGLPPVGVIAPSTYGLLPGASTTFQDLCDHSGAENLAATLGHLVGNAPQPSEEMLVWPIDFVVVSGRSLSGALAPFRDLPPYEYLEVVRDAHAVLLPSWALGCVSHHRIVGYEIMARAFHPEAFK